MKLIINNLTKKYDKKIALNKVNLTMENGIYALLGPNGAGKTTLIHCIIDLINYDEGLIEYTDDAGNPIHSIFDVLGYLPQYPSFYKNFTVMEMLQYFAVLKDLDKKIRNERIDEVLHDVNLSESKNLKIKALSGGMKQRLGIAQAILNHPKLLIVDEPTAGLDPKERIRFRNIIKNISNDTIVIFATHIVSDIELIADNIIMLKEGNVIVDEKREHVLDIVQDKIWEIEDTKENADRIIKQYQVLEAYWIKKQVHIKIVNDVIPSKNARKVSPRLEDLYMYHFGDTL